MSGTAEARGTRIEFSRAFLRVRGTKTFLRRDLQRGLKLRLVIGAPCPIRSEFPPAPRSSSWPGPCPFVAEHQRDSPQRRPFLRSNSLSMSLNCSTASSCSSIRPRLANTSCSPCGDESIRRLKSKAKSFTSASSAWSLASYSARFVSSDMVKTTGFWVNASYAAGRQNRQSRL